MTRTIAALILPFALAACGTSSPGEPRPTPDAEVLTFDAAMLGGDGGALPPPGDGGGFVPDGGGFVPDGGGGWPVDAGQDAGPPPTGDCILYVPRGQFGPLLPVCLPRCSASTAATYRACTTRSCRNAAIDADRTPGISYYIGSAPVTTSLECNACIAYQEMHCFSLVCRVQVDRYVDECIAGGSDLSCDNALYALDDCLALLTPGQESTVGACMSSEQGVEGCFP